MTIVLGDLMQNWEERVFSNLQLGMRNYVRIIMIMMLEYRTLAHKKIPTETLINRQRPFLLGRRTIRFIT